MNTLEFLGGGGGNETPRWGHSPRMGSVGSGALSHFFRVRVYLIHWNTFLRGSTHFTFHGGALISYIYISCFMMTSSNGNMFASLAFVQGIHRWLRGIHRLPVNSPHTDQWRGALMFSLICAWTNGWVNNQGAGDMRRHRAHYDVTVMWCRIVIQWFGQPWDLSAFNASLLSNIWGVLYIMVGMASNLAHCSTLIPIPWN